MNPLNRALLLGPAVGPADQDRVFERRPLQPVPHITRDLDTLKDSIPLS